MERFRDSGLTSLYKYARHRPGGKPLWKQAAQARTQSFSLTHRHSSPPSRPVQSSHKMHFCCVCSEPPPLPESFTWIPGQLPASPPFHSAHSLHIPKEGLILSISRGITWLNMQIRFRQESRGLPKVTLTWRKNWAQVCWVFKSVDPDAGVFPWSNRNGRNETGFGVTQT